MPGYVYRGTKPLHLEADDDTTATRAECGTRDGINAHRRHKEKQCDDCRKVAAADLREYRANYRGNRKKANA